MAIFWDAPVAPDAQTTFMREIPYPSNLGLLNIFGRRDLETDTIDFAEIVSTNRTARYRSWDGRVHVSERDTGSESRVRMIPLSTSIGMGEYERLQYQYATMGAGTNEDRLARAIYNDSERLTREVQNRLELAWGDVLADGVLSISEGGLTGTAGTVDYGVPANQKTTVGTAWATLATAPALTDIQTVVDTYKDNNGGLAPGFVGMSTATRRNLRRNRQVIDAVFGSTGGRTQVSEQELSNLLADEFDGLGLLPTYDSSVDVDGATVRTLAADKVFFLPPNLDDLGYTAFGTTVTALELVNSGRTELSFQEAPGIVGIVTKSDGIPFRQQVMVDALAMPVLSNAKLLSILDVTP